MFGVTVPPARQCSLPTCEREAVDPLRNGALCDFHLDSGDGGEPVTEPEESAGSEADRDLSEANSQTLDTNDRGGWQEADFSDPTPGVWPSELLEREQWMGHVGKKPFAPWGDRDHPDADPDEDARWKWGLTENYVDGATIAVAEDDHRLDGRAFLQRESDPYAYVDGDDVRCPETGDVHPAFLEALEQLGLTYADVSQSGSGVHAQYRGELPDGVKQAAWELDDELWSANDEDLPSIEIYAGKRVCVATGEHVPGTPTEIREWDADGLEALLEANDQIPDRRPDVEPARERFDLESYEPSTVSSDETTDDIRDVFAAIGRLDAQRVAARTIVAEWNDDASTSDGERAFWPTWGSRSDNGTANVVNSDRWMDTGARGGYGGPVSMAAIDANACRESDPPVDGETWWRGVEHLRDLGFDVPEYEPSHQDDDREPVAPIALARLEQLEGRQRERFLDTLPDGTLAPTTDRARDRLRDALYRELRAGNTTVLDAPTALGKSHTAATTDWLYREDLTDNKPVIQLHATCDARDDAMKATRDSSATGAVLKGRKERCNVAAGDHDPDPDAPADEQPDPVVTIDGQAASEWLDTMCDQKGLPFSMAHAMAADRNDQELEALPCCAATGECPAHTQWENIPWEDISHRCEDVGQQGHRVGECSDCRDGSRPAVDVVHATHQFAHVPSLRSFTNVIVDEQPDFTVDFTDAGTPTADTGRIRSMVTAYLTEIDAPLTTWEGLTTAAHGGSDEDTRDELEELLTADAPTPDREWYVDHPDAHALAPDLTRAVWKALRDEEPDAAGQRATKVFHEPPRFDADGYDGAWLSVVIDDENTVKTVRHTPDFSNARAVIGLDAHPSMPMWQLNVDAGMTRDTILDTDERRRWRRYVRGLTVVQVGTGDDAATRPRSGEKAREWMHDERVRTLLETLRDHYGSDFRTTIAPIQVERAVGQLLEDVTGGEDAETMHYGEEKSRNDFADEAVGYLYGCMDPGDDMIVDALTELGLDARPVTVETDDGGVKREKGRTFEGPDADTAAALLASVRENHVAQAAGRYARNPDNPDDHGTVYVDTDAMPTGFADLEVPGVEWLATDLQREIIDELVSRPAATTRELADAVDCTKEHVRQTLSRLAEKGLVERDPRAGDHGADVYRDEAATDALVDLGETTNDPLQDNSRASLAIHDRHASSSGDTDDGAVGEGVATDGGRPNGGDRPPDAPE